MKSSLLPLSLFTSLFAGLLTTPLAVSAQSAPTLNANQVVTINGNNNTVNQQIIQNIIYRPGSGNGSSKTPSNKKDKSDDKKYGRYNSKHDPDDYDRGKDKDGHWDHRYSSYDRHEDDHDRGHGNDRDNDHDKWGRHD